MKRSAGAALLAEQEASRDSNQQTYGRENYQHTDGDFDRYNVVIDTRNRYKGNPPGCTLRVVPPRKNVIRFELASLIIKHTFYNVSEVYSNVFAFELNGTPYAITIPEGHYNEFTLIAAVNAALAAVTPSLTLSYDPINGRVDINNSSGGAFIPTVVTSTPTADVNLLAIMLGFNPEVQESFPSGGVSQAPFQVQTRLPYAGLALDISTVPSQTSVPKGISQTTSFSFFIPITGIFGQEIEYTSQIGFRQVSVATDYTFGLDTITITLRDCNGRRLSRQVQDFSFVLNIIAPSV